MILLLVLKLLLLRLRWLATTRLKHQLIEDLIRKLLTPPFRCRRIHLLLLLLLHLTLQLLLIFSLQSCFFLCLPELMSSYLIHTSLNESFCTHLPICTVSSLALLRCKIFVIFLLLKCFIGFTSLLVDVVVTDSAYHILFFEFKGLLDERTITNWRLTTVLVIVVCGLLHLFKWPLILKLHLFDWSLILELHRWIDVHI